MKRKRFIILTSIVLVGIVCIWLSAKKNSAEQMIVNRLNEAVSHYTDMNIKDDKTYSLKVSDTTMLVTTYVPEYTIPKEVYDLIDNYIPYINYEP